MARTIDDSARVKNATIGASELREYVTIHDAEVGDDCRIYERVSVKKSTIGDSVDVNAGTYVENATIERGVQLGPNSNVVGVTHDLTTDGMTFRNDVFEEVVLREGVFVGTGAVVGPGVEIGRNAVVAAGAVVADDVDPEVVVLGSPPDQRVVPLDEWIDKKSE